jgi:Ca2+-transporting ATPase
MATDEVGIVVKQMKTVETLGSATVICTDKTGTITENKMTLAKLFVLSSTKISNPSASQSDDVNELIRVAMWASEPIPFDPMELSLHEAYGQMKSADERQDFRMRARIPPRGQAT